MQKKMTTIKARMLRGMIIAVAAATIILTTICTLVLFLTIYHNSENNSIYTLNVYSSFISGTLQNIKGDKADEEIKSIVSEIKLSENAYGYIINNNGDIIFHPDGKQVTGSVNYVTLAKTDDSYKDYAQFTKTILSGKAKSDVFRVDGTRCYLTGIRIKDSDGWYLISVQPYKNIIKDYYLLLFICIGTTALLIFFATVIAFIVANKIQRSLNAVTDRLNKLSQGDLDSPVPVVNSNDETEILANSLNVTIYNLNSYVADIDRVLGAVSNGDLTTVSSTEYSGSFVSIKQALNEILRSLNTIFKDVVISTETIKSTATQVASGAGLLSDNAANEAATLQELSSTVSTVSEMVTSNASSAAQASKLAASSNIRMSDGAKKMAELTEAMHDIEASADEISKINKVIEDIAFQTNILALNASVEAARAGEAGKGFAVVADEVRNLASKSSQASQNTSVLIANAICGIRTGAKLADETTESLNGIVDMVNNVNKIMGEIARASNEQATAIYQISQGMENITNSVQTTSATAEESAAASQELSNRSSQTMNLVGKYRTK